MLAVPQWVYTLRNLPLRAAALLLIGIVRLLPANAAYGFGAGLAAFIWRLNPQWRHTAARNLELIFGERYTPAERLAIGLKAARNLGWYVIEFVRMGTRPVDEGLAMVVETEGIEHMEEALKAGRGAIGLAMHYGNWDLSGAYVTAHIRQLYAVGKPQSDEFFTRLAFPWRAKYGIKNIFSGKRLNSALLRALKENCVLGLLADQNGGTTGTFARFAGIPASTVAGPAALALKFDCPLLIVHTRRLAPGRHRFIIRPPLDTSGLPADREAAQVELLERINQAYVDVISEDPSQWLLGHKRFKTRPAGEDWLY